MAGTGAADHVVTGAAVAYAVTAGSKSFDEP